LGFQILEDVFYAQNAAFEQFGANQSDDDQPVAHRPHDHGREAHQQQDDRALGRLLHERRGQPGLPVRRPRLPEELLVDRHDRAVAGDRDPERSGHDKTFAPAPNPTAGELVTYTIAVTNAGPSTADDVTARHILPAEFYASAPVPTGTFTGGGTCVWLPLVRNMRCAIDALAPGQTETITITTRLAPDGRGKTVLNSVGAISDSVDPHPALATDAVSFVPIPAADLELTKLAPPDPVTPGGVARFTFQFANRGPSNAPDVVLRDTLPSGLTFVSDTAGACTAAGQAVTCALDALNADA